MKQPTVYYICKFPMSKYNNRTYFDSDQKDLADRFVKHVWERYKINGTVKKVVEVEEK